MVRCKFKSGAKAKILKVSGIRDSESASGIDVRNFFTWTEGECHNTPNKLKWLDMLKKYPCFSVVAAQIS
eukprot:4672627-Amphidinium_carterae.1